MTHPSVLRILQKEEHDEKKEYGRGKFAASISAGVPVTRIPHDNYISTIFIGESISFVILPAP
jgi:hypothetical protein